MEGENTRLSILHCGSSPTQRSATNWGIKKSYLQIALHVIQPPCQKLKPSKRWQIRSAMTSQIIKAPLIVKPVQSLRLWDTFEYNSV